MMRDACDQLIAASTELLRTLVGLAREHRDTVMIGRTHGIHAEPTTFGAKVALWALQVDRDRDRLRRARDTRRRVQAQRCRRHVSATSTRSSSSTSPSASGCARCRRRR